MKCINSTKHCTCNKVTCNNQEEFGLDYESTGTMIYKYANPVNE